ncbi:YcnI family protein [Pseudonocardia broussonetiae]|uniref:YcnI family protein n=1 Tax=Pseudonocardia broussonetiae TaxID=2736640 RepID=A0A6M6JCJ3_9PSEU|nr:YcnI family protein [Pseudonocardia broussonetiae]QJY45668.1 YcnI family protein [Pseudonocardia broussonetiae]
MSARPRRLALRAATVLAAASAAVLVTAAPAFAHVTAQAGEVRQGGYGVVTLRVPTESDTAGTVALRVTLPAEHPLRSVRTSPVPGWTAVLERSGETVTAVTWTADPGVRVGPGQFADFPLSLGPLPTDTDLLVLPAVQTYDDGEVVAWDQPPTADGSEPERPAPTVELLPAEDATGADPAGTGDGTARWIGGAGLLVGALGLGLGGGAVLQNRRRAKEESTR